MSIKLIAVDIDGTLLNSQRQVTPEVFQAIQDAKAAGVKVVIATGRPIPGVLPLLEELTSTKTETMLSLLMVVLSKKLLLVMN